MLFKRAFMFLVLGLLLVQPAGFALAQDGNIVREIIIEGSRRIQATTIRSYLLIQEGDRFDARRIDRSLKSLFATGLFNDVNFKRRGDALVIKVVENPVINRIAFEGNKRLSDEDLTQEITLRPRVVFTRTKVRKDVQRILDLYRFNGRFATTVDPKVIRLEQNRADLVYEINEGPKTGIEKISFVGNRVASDSDLRGVIRTKESAWYRFFTADDTYDGDRLTFDRELLRRFYLNEGYADFRVESSVAELTSDRKTFFITFTIDEGRRYKFGKLDIEAGLRGLDVGKLKSLITPKNGEWFNNEDVDEVVEELTDAVGTMGFAFVEVRPRINRNRKTRKIDIDFVVAEGPRVFIERINISGNVRTVDKVIRREFRLVEGDAFNAAKLRRSRQRIKDLNFFEKVEVERVPGSAADKAVVNMKVEEKSTGSLSLGAGFSTDLGPVGDISLTERNLLGKGQTLKLRTSIAAEKSTFDIGFTEPYFLDREIAVGVDLFHVNRDFSDASSYSSKQTGVGLRAGYPLTDEFRQDWKYSFRFSEVSNISANASNLIKTQKGSEYISEISHGITYDTRDSRLNPTEGLISSLDTDLAGLGGNVFFLRNTLSANNFFNIAKGWVLSVGGEVGYILGLGEDVGIAHRFSLGGDTLRGFETSGIGPRDRVTKDALGGEWMYRGRVELKLPLGLPDELSLGGKLFADFGSVGAVSPSGSNVFDSGSLRASVGTGVVWSSPLGPISIDFGVPVIKESVDEIENIRVNFGARF